MNDTGSTGSEAKGEQRRGEGAEEYTFGAAGADRRTDSTMCREKEGKNGKDGEEMSVVGISPAERTRTTDGESFVELL